MAVTTLMSVTQLGHQHQWGHYTLFSSLLTITCSGVITVHIITIRAGGDLRQCLVGGDAALAVALKVIGSMKQLYDNNHDDICCTEYVFPINLYMYVIPCAVLQDSEGCVRSGPSLRSSLIELAQRATPSSRNLRFSRFNSSSDLKENRLVRGNCALEDFPSAVV